MDFRNLAFILVAGILSSCAQDNIDTIAPDVADTAIESAAAPTPPPSFSTAMDRYQPLNKVVGAGQGSPLPVAEPSDRFAEAAAYAEKTQSFSLLIWQGGKIVHEQYFAPFDANLRPESASMHKSVLGLVVGAAIDDGLITSVNEPVATYLTEWVDDPRGEITIANLLQMASGLKPLSYVGGPESEAIRFGNGENVRETILNMELLNAPQSVFHYAGTNSQLLGLIIERATGQPYAKYLSETIWAPLGASEAFVWLDQDAELARTYAALLAKAEDWLRVGLLIKDRGFANGTQIVSGDYIDDMTAPSPANPNYGYQIWLGTEFDPDRYYNDAEAGFAVFASEPYAVDDIVFFDGFGGQRVYISRSLDLVIIRTGEVQIDWDDAKLPNLVIKALSE